MNSGEGQTPFSVAELPAIAWPIVIGVAATVAVAHALIATRYGWHRDEFYYVASGRHLAWGYPDQPPLTPVLARLAAALPGGVLPLRLVAIFLQAGTIVLGGLLARELGGGRRAQGLAAGCVAGCAVFMGASLLLGTTIVDQFAWVLIIWLVLRSSRLGSVGSWLAAGAAVGVGLENKSTVAVLVGGLAIGLIVRRRSALRGPGPWIAAGLAVVLWLPNLWWDATHHWINFDMARVISNKQGGFAGSVAQLPLLLLLYSSPLLVIIWVRGVRWATTGGGVDDWSWLVVSALVIVVVLTVAGGKPYYPAPLFAPFFAMGCVAIEAAELGRQRSARWVIPMIALAVVSSALLSLPFVTPRVSTLTRPVASDPMETYGWSEFARQVAAAAADDPGTSAIYTSNYGERGALDQYGRQVGLRLPVVTGQNAYRYWGHPSGRPDNVLAVGEFDSSFLRRSWHHVELVGRIRLPSGLVNEETDNDAAIYQCTDPRGSWAQLWPRLTYLS
jgi:hypothetical protein